MRVAGIIAEYNPFHRGHQYHLRQARELTGAEAVVVVMSGSFVQRGEPALTDKFSRAAMAIRGGADVVLELPVPYATASAETFAGGAVEILDSLGVVTDLVYGCECPEPARISHVARILTEEPFSFREHLHAELRRGCAYPEARSAALEVCCPGNRDLLRSPNNILAVEYHKALLRRGSKIHPVALQRSGEEYHSLRLSSSAPASASAIRQEFARLDGLLAAEGKQHAPGCLPAEALRTAFPDSPLWTQLPEFCIQEIPWRLYPDDFSALLRCVLLRTSPEELTDIQDMSPALAARLKHFSGQLLTCTELAEQLKTRQITRTRVNRALLHTLLELPSSQPPITAVRLLAMRRGTPVMRAIQNHSEIPIVTKLADAPVGSLEADNRAEEMFRTALWQKTGYRLNTENRLGPLLL
ncbi:MAG: nucleotidyltransferase family protein [Lachnospiraceae bacterium]|nr:nucleotidyltransferase family protein [Lachnospiraceae bacterium]